jgi:hypothetical protein
VRSWVEQVTRTWLQDESLVRELDSWVRTRLAAHRRLPPKAYPDVVAAGVSALIADIRSFGTESRWFWASSAICLLAELVFAADVGGTFASRKRRTLELPTIALAPLVILRNALLHPAHQSWDAGAGEPHVARLVEWLEENSEGPLAQLLETSWAALGSRGVSEFALRRLDAAGRDFTRRMGFGRD